MMLQQTQVTTVVPYFEKWMRKFPDVRVLARAPEDEVLRAWAGLGYYARARNLHRAARMLAEQGGYPPSVEGWRALPGIGAYTAGAIASLALKLREPIVDGNVVRVLSRVFGLAFLPGDGRGQREAYWKLARAWSDTSSSGDTNEALMELGALVCVPGNPRCAQCPLASGCKARLKGLQNTLPPLKRRPPTEVVEGVVLVIRNRNRILLETRPKGGFLSGHLSFPLFLEGGGKNWETAYLRRVPGGKPADVRESGIVRHAIMNRRYLLRVLRVDLPRPGVMPTGKETVPQEWVRDTELPEILTNSLTRKVWKTANS